MSDQPRKRRGPLTWLAARTWRFWVMVALAQPFVYVGSFGPACWLAAIPIVPPASSPARLPNPVMRVYWPLGKLLGHGAHVGRAVGWWVKFWIPDGKFTQIPSSPLGPEHVALVRWG